MANASNCSEAQRSKSPKVTGGILEGGIRIHIYKLVVHIANNWLGSPVNRRQMLAGSKRADLGRLHVGGGT